MRIGGQISLLGGAGRGHLFGAGLLKRYTDSHKTTAIPFIDENARKLATWLDSVSSTPATESTLEGRFVNDVFCGVLGYVLYPTAPGTSSSIYPKPSAQVTRIGRTPDALLGEFSGDVSRFTAVLELKTPGTDLDAPQPRKNNETPVEQGFYYGKRILGVRWVVVSDMRRIRLYSVESDSEYEEIELNQCMDSSGRPTEAYKRLHFLLHHDYLVKEHERSQVSALHEKSAAQQLEVRDSFYQAYYEIRADLYQAIKAAAHDLSPRPDRRALLEATQRLLDRLVFMFFCEDHPQQLIPRGTVERVCDAARLMPGASNSKVYTALKSLFREVDAGSPPGNKIRIYGYNGELFKRHPVIDEIELPDRLHDQLYVTREAKGRQRRIEGVWGLHEYDFWTELNEHLLGHIFEQSLSDLSHVGVEGAGSAAERLKERKKGGIYYTSSILSDFLANSAIQASLDETSPIDRESNLEQSLHCRLSSLLGLRVADFACGSGAFLVSAYHELLREYWRLQSSIAKVSSSVGQAGPDLFFTAATTDQAGLLRQCLYGVDKLPQAAEIAKLALWLGSARKGERVADLGTNIVDADSLMIDRVLERLSLSPGSLDLVIGNPPWGGDIDPAAHDQATRSLGVLPDEALDSWELFLLLGLYALREGGRLALVLPDSFFYTEKERTRKRLLSLATVEKLHYLGPDWFGSQVRMGTIVLQARRGSVDRNADIQCFVISGDLRRQAIRGKIPVSQIEAQMAHAVPMARALDSRFAEFEVFRGARDDRIMQTVDSNSVVLGVMCERGRGEEINKAGLLWICPSCSALTTPGVKMKGGGYDGKTCPTCGCGLTKENVRTVSLIDPAVDASSVASYIDGDDICRRYQTVTTSKRIRTDVRDWPYKPRNLYASPKILIRQAGVGIVAALDETDAYCPQSVYIYRLVEPWLQEGYAHEYVLAALLSRTMTYYIFKRYGEIDPAKAHSKLTHDRLAHLPIPTLNMGNADDKATHDVIVENVRRLMNGSAKIGGPEDTSIELLLRRAWQIGPEDGAYINGQFYGLDNSQVVQDLFPDGPPKPQDIAPIEQEPVGE